MFQPLDHFMSFFTGHDEKSLAKGGDTVKAYKLPLALLTGKVQKYLDAEKVFLGMKLQEAKTLSDDKDERTKFVTDALCEQILELPFIAEAQEKAEDRFGEWLLPILKTMAYTAAKAAVEKYTQP